MEHEVQVVVGDFFPSLKDLQAAVRAYEVSSKAVYVIHDSKTVEARNRQCKNPWPEHLVYTNLEYACKHYGEVRSKSRGLRPNQSTFKTGCESIIKFSTQRSPLGFLVRAIVPQHKHPLNEEYVEHFPEMRRLDAEEKNSAQEFSRLQVKPALAVNELCMKTGKVVLPQDLVNMRAKRRRDEMEGSNETEYLIRELNKMKEKDPTLHVQIGYEDKDDRKIIQYIFIMTEAMLENFKKFPEVLLMDSTFKTNKNDMNLFVIMCEDGFGCGQVVAFAFITHQSTAILAEILTKLKVIVGNYAEKIKVCIVDKEKGQIKAIKNVLNTPVQLCLLHTLNIFDKESASEKNKREVRDCLYTMVYSTSVESYNREYDVLKKVASTTFMQYFDTFWHTIPEAWTRANKMQYPNYGNDTTNRVESNHAKFKRVLESSDTILDAITKILLLLRNKSQVVRHKQVMACVKKSYVTNSSDPDVQNILDCCTKYASALVKHELELSKKELPSDHVNPYKTTTVSCSCYFAKMRELPCKHIMRLREAGGLNPFDISLVGQRWLKSYNADVDNLDIPVGGLHVVRMPKKIIPKNRNEKYKEALQVSNKLVECMASCGTEEYAVRMQLLEDLVELWKCNKLVVLQPIDAAVQETAATKPFDEVSVQNKLPKGSHIAVAEKESTCVESNVPETGPHHGDLILELPSPQKKKGRSRGRDRTIFHKATKKNGSQLSQTRKPTNVSCDSDSSCEDNLLPLCECNQLAGRGTVRAHTENYKREFFSCAQRVTEKKCNFFQWADDNTSHTPLRDSCLQAGNGSDFHESEENKVVSDMDDILEALESQDRRILQTACDTLGVQATKVPPETKERMREYLERKSSQPPPPVLEDSSLLNNYEAAFFKCSSCLELCDTEILADVTLLLCTNCSVPKKDPLPSVKEINSNTDLWTEYGNNDDFDEDLADLIIEDDFPSSPLSTVIEDFDTPKDVLEQSTDFPKNEPTSMINNIANQSYIPQCNCKPKQICLRKTSRKDNKNFMEDFYCCPSRKCGYFRWVNSLYNINSPSGTGHSSSTSDKVPEVPKKKQQLITDFLEENKPQKLGSQENRFGKGGTLPKGEFKGELSPGDQIGMDFPTLQPNERAFVEGYTLTAHDLETLLPSCWVNDNIIDSVVKIFSGTEFVKDEYLAILRLSCVTTENIMMGMDSYIEAAGTDFWLFNDIWLVPCHVSRNHWILVVVLVKRKKILILDSLQPKGPLNSNVMEHLQVIWFLIWKSHIQCFGKPPTIKEWSVHAPQDIPKQSNGYDCGVIVCMWSYSICTTNDQPQDVCKHSNQVRSWLANLILTRAQRSIYVPIPASTSDDVEIIQKVYNELDEKLIKGLIKIEKPWLDLHKPRINRNLVENTPTTSYLGSILKNYWKATDVLCGAQKCSGKLTKEMHLCEGCREFYHVRCINDIRKLPTQATHYLCPMHDVTASDRSRETRRVIQLPLRLRKSL